jgi:tetratricopeptide (TPR) repeat protein
MTRLIGASIVFIVTAAIPGARAENVQAASDAIVWNLRIASEEAGRGDISSALADTRAAIALDPNRFDGWYELGSLLGQTGDFPAAEAAFRRAIELKRDVAKAHYSLALTLIGNPQGKMDWAGAIAECREALKFQPDYPEALNLLGAGLSATGQTDGAIPELQRATQLLPSLAEAHFNLGIAFESKDRFEEATKEYRAAIAARGAYPEAVSALGDLLLRIGKSTEAEQALNQALRLNPDLTNAHYALARLLRSLDRKSEAAVEFAETKDLTDRPENGIQSSQISNQALELAAKGDMAGAAALLRKAIALKPDYGVPHYNLGLISADRGDTDSALQELIKAISLLPGQAKPWFDYGRVLKRAKDDRQALEAISWAARLAPSDTRIQSELASAHGSKPTQDIVSNPDFAVSQPKVGAFTDSAKDHRAFALELTNHGDIQGSVGELLRSLSLEPASIETRRLLAESYVRIGDNHHAILEYYKVIRSDPDYVETRIAMGKILLADGDAEGAVNQLTIALGHRPDSDEARVALVQAKKALSNPQ